ncbi:MAG: nitroreductase family deazaflavin-dependent oxidoreductase [Actinomycetota bacterium]|nr:nitroreductase family deazaflavin-dependent oxidoreductase [Actinomycetota bacterium]
MTSRKPRPILISLLRAPAHLYDRRAGWLLGRRFLRLTHLGRRSGQRYQTMLEVIGEDPKTREVFVIAGLGSQAQWYRNLLAHDAIEVAISHERFTPTHRQLNTTEAAAVLARYEHRNRLIAPIIRRLLSWLVGWPYDGTQVARQRLVTQLPVIGLRPTSRP